MIYELVFLFLARTIDMCLSTLRHVLVVRGMRWSAGGVGFLEIVVYTVALGLVVGAGTDVLRLTVFSLGFAAGIVLGVTIEDRLAFGYRLMHITLSREEGWIVPELREKGIPVTVLDANGHDGGKMVLGIVAKRKHAREIAADIAKRIPDAFVVSTEPKHLVGGAPLFTGHRPLRHRW